LYGENSKGEIMGWTNGIILGILGVLIGVTIFGGMGTATGYLLGFIALISGVNVWLFNKR